MLLTFRSMTTNMHIECVTLIGTLALILSLLLETPRHVYVYTYNNVVLCSQSRLSGMQFMK